MTAPHVWIAIYALSPIVALVLIWLCSKLWLKRKERLAAKQVQYHEANMRAEIGFEKVECAGTALDPAARPRLQRLAALCEQLRDMTDVVESERLVSRFVYDEHAALEDEMFAVVAVAEARELESARAGIPWDNQLAPLESDEAYELAYAERMKPHQTVEEAVEYYVLHEHMKLDEALLEKFGFPPERARQLWAADQVRECMRHYSFPETLTIENAERLLAEFEDDMRRSHDEMMRGSNA